LAAEVEKLASDLRVAEGKWALTKQTLDQTSSDLDEAQAALRTLQASTQDYRLYQESQTALQTAYGRQRIQQGLIGDQARHQQALAAALANAQQAERQVAQARGAQQKMVELAPKVEEQTRLEQQLSEAQQQTRRLGEVEQEQTRLQAAYAALAADVARQAQQIASIESQQAEAALLTGRRAEVERLSLEVGRRADWERELPEVRSRLTGAEAQRQKADAAVVKKQADVDKLLATRGVVATLPALEEEWNELRQQVILLTGNIKRHNESKLQSAGGQCPFLKEPCLNIRQKGLLSLETYFDNLIARDQEALAPLEARETILDQQVQDVRLKKSYVDRLDEFQQSLRDAQDQQAQWRQELQRLKVRERELVSSLSAASKSAARLTEAQALWKQSDEADKQVRTLAGLRSQQESAQRNLDEQSRRIAQLRAEHAVLVDAPACEAKATQQLSTLGNPRREYAQQEGIAAQEQHASEQLRAARQSAAQAEEALAALEAQLTPYAGLDEHIARLNQDIEQSRAGYQTYLAYEQMAGRAPERQRAYDAALKDERGAYERHAQAQQRHAAKAASYDASELEKAKQLERRLSDDLIQMRADLRSLQEKIDAKEQQIEAAQEKLAELDAA
ncbi:MAG TPA: hypothetical protein VKQ36_05940, partial [Ktedonobacterales bacterium]|nr:hypothetical protein [Ktedonobacterales bacterium]